MDFYTAGKKTIIKAIKKSFLAFHHEKTISPNCTLGRMKREFAAN